MSDLVGNPEDRYSHNEAHLVYLGCKREPALCEKTRQLGLQPFNTTAETSLRLQIRALEAREILLISKQCKTNGLNGTSADFRIGNKAVFS